MAKTLEFFTFAYIISLQEKFIKFPASSQKIEISFHRIFE